MYITLYNLLAQYIYGASAVLTEFQDLTLTIIATAGCLFVVALPFALVWRVIKLVSGN